MASRPIPLLFHPSDEQIPFDESEDIEYVLNALKALLVRSHSETGKYQSDVHVKTVGLAKGELKVLPGLWEELAQGLFASEKTYQIIARFSNGAGAPQADALPDGRGLAIKVLGVTEETISTEQQSVDVQDFVMINHPVFFIKNVKDYLRVEEALVKAKGSPALIAKEAIAASSWNPLHWHWREMFNIARAFGHAPKHPAGNTYFSMTSILFGKYIAKYRVIPSSDLDASYLKLLENLVTFKDGLGESLAATLKAQPVYFDFQVQLRTSASTMPIEDATIEWPEVESSYQTVANITLPIQDIYENQRQEFLQDLSFNIWNALKDHRPLGGINRLRRSVYMTSAAWRRQTPSTLS